MDPMGTIAAVLISVLMFQQMSTLNSSSIGKLPGAWYSQSRGQSTIECVEVPKQWESDDPVSPWGSDQGRQGFSCIFLLNEERVFLNPGIIKITG